MQNFHFEILSDSGDKACYFMSALFGISAVAFNTE